MIPGNQGEKELMPHLYAGLFHGTDEAGLLDKVFRDVLHFQTVKRL